MSTAVAEKPTKAPKSAKTPTKVKNAVGINGENKTSHILLIQDLLNRNLHLLPKTYPLVENGRNIQATIQVILSFQAIVVKKGPIDGRVDLYGNTYKLLLKNARRRRPANVKKFIAFVLKDAQKVNKKYKIPVSIAIAQGGQETGWGKNVKGNAYFGVKAHNTKGATTTFTTHEHLKGTNGKKTKVKMNDSFRAYKNISEAAEDYGKFLTTNKRYKPCFSFTKKPYKFAEKLGSAPYATDPDYGKKIKRLLKLYYLTDYDRVHLIKAVP